MVTCPRCARPHLAAERACPFCASGAVVPVRRVFSALMAVLAPVALVACDGIGSSGCDTSTDTACSTTDADGDGYTSDVDCDEANPDINPAAAEVCDDGIDNDCDDVKDADDSDCS